MAKTLISGQNECFLVLYDYVDLVIAWHRKSFYRANDIHISVLRGFMGNYWRFSSWREEICRYCDGAEAVQKEPAEAPNYKL